MGFRVKKVTKTLRIGVYRLAFVNNLLKELHFLDSDNFMLPFQIWRLEGSEMWFGACFKSDKRVLVQNCGQRIMVYEMPYMMVGVTDLA